jgi:hypothetical protein
MAKVLNHCFIGKLGGIVYSLQDGKNIARAFTPPSNPRTPEQMAHRLVFGKVNKFTKSIYRNVLQPYTFPRPKSSNLAIFNRMTQINGLILSTDVWDPANLKIFEGPLENPGISSAVLTGNTVKVTFDTDLGEEDDVAIAVVYDDKTSYVYYAVGTRSAGFLDVRLTQMASKNVDTLHAYLVFSRPSPNYGKPYPFLQNYGSKGIVSTTAYKKVG